jgi:hypothetical protein
MRHNAAVALGDLDGSGVQPQRAARVTQVRPGPNGLT